MSEDKNVIQFPLKGESDESVEVEVEICVKALFFDGNHLWVDIYYGSDGQAINTEPVSLGPGSTIILRMNKK